MKKILGLTVALIAVIAMLGTGTWAYFNDVVTSDNNTITAGTLTLTPGGIASGHFDITKVKPKEVGTAGTGYAVTNGANDINGDLYVKFSDLVSAAGPKTGVLKDKLQLAIWVDANSSGAWNAGDYYISPLTGAKVAHGAAAGTIDTILPDAAYGTPDNFATNCDGSDKLEDNKAGGTNFGTFFVKYNFPNTPGDRFTINADNIYQGAAISFDLAFALVQAGE